MKEIEKASRERYAKMLNLLPDMIATKQAPSFFYYNQTRFIDWDKINLDHIQVRPPLREDPASKLRRRFQLQKNQIATMKLLGKHKQLKVDDADLHLETIVGNQEGNPIQFQPYSLQRAALYDKGCITCGKQNILVKYHKDRHICLECRQKVTTLKGDPVVNNLSYIKFIFQDDDGEVVVLGIADSAVQGRQVYQVPPDELDIFGYRCYVTFSAPDDLIVLLHDGLNAHKAGPSLNYQKRRQVFQKGRKSQTNAFDVNYKRESNAIKRNKKAITIFCDERGKHQSAQALTRKRDSSFLQPNSNVINTQGLPKKKSSVPILRPRSIMKISSSVQRVSVITEENV